MPLIPRGLTPKFVDRLTDRLKRELGDRVDGLPESFSREDLSRRLKDKLREQLGLDWQEGDITDEPFRLEEPTIAGPPQGPDDVIHRLQVAMRQGVYVHMRYHNVYRDVEPYSFRWRGIKEYHQEQYKDPNTGRARTRTTKVKDSYPLFYGWCTKDKGIEAFKIEKIQDLQVTKRHFNPRWPVEPNY